MDDQINGWVKIHRKFLKWGWYQKSEMVHLFLHFLMLANHEDHEWQGLTIKRGQCVVGRKKLAQDTGISQQTIRTCIARLKSTSEITSKTTNKYTIITVVKYSDYQIVAKPETEKSTKSLTNNQPTTNQQLTTNKKSKKIKKYNASKKDAALPMDRKGFVEWCRTSKLRHIRIIGEYVDQKKSPDFTTRAQWEKFIKRNLRAATQLVPYTDDQLATAMERIEKANYITRWTLETLYKYLVE